MANKRYDQFPAGTYDTSKIFLQADPLTGALEKINLPDVVNALLKDGSVQLTADWNAGEFNIILEKISTPTHTTYPAIQLINQTSGLGMYSPHILFLGRTSAGALRYFRILSNGDSFAFQASNDGVTFNQIGAISSGGTWSFSGASFSSSGVLSCSSITTSGVATSALSAGTSIKPWEQPRLTSVQIAAIASPVEGSFCYNKTTKKMNFYDGTAWREIQSL